MKSPALVGAHIGHMQAGVIATLLEFVITFDVLRALVDGDEATLPSLPSMTKEEFVQVRKGGQEFTVERTRGFFMSR
jgi:hypothetical protein